MNLHLRVHAAVKILATPMPMVHNRIRWTVSDDDKAERLDDVEPRYPPTG